MLQKRNKISDLSSSTVSKIVHRDQFQCFPLDQVSLEMVLPQTDVRSSLQSWVEEKSSKGIPPTRAMIRKQAAILGASAWLQDSDGNACGPKPGAFEWQNACLIEKPTLGMMNLLKLAYMLECV